MDVLANMSAFWDFVLEWMQLDLFMNAVVFVRMVGIGGKRTVGSMCITGKWCLQCRMLLKCPTEFLLSAPSFSLVAPLRRASEHNLCVSSFGSETTTRETRRVALIRHRWPGLPLMINASKKEKRKKKVDIWKSEVRSENGRCKT